MIRPIQITLNAAHPELPLIEASTYVGSPSTAFVRGVPAAIGNWKITAVRVIFHYPDESVVAAACVNSATGVWVGTIAPTATSGRVANGYQILADGTDENGDAVTGYVLGMGDLAVYTRDMTIDAGETFWYFHYFDTAPTTPKKSDVAHVDGVLKFYNGSAWESFAAGITLDDAVAPTSANGVKSSGIWSAIWGALTALPSGFTSLYDWVVSQLSGKASTADATLTERYGATATAQWTITYPQGWAHGTVYITWFDEFAPIGWVADCDGDRFGPFSDNPNATTLTGEVYGETITATRTALPGYQLGSQSSKPLASEAEAEALRAEVAGKLSSSDVIDPANATASGRAADALATKTALAARPTKSQLDEGWWSDWTILRDGVDVTAQVAQPSYDETEGEWKIGLVSGDDIGMPYTQGGPDATALSWIADDSGHNAVTYTATRHRVAAPVPTKPEDIGAASRAANPTAGNLAALDANGNPTDSGKTPADFMAAGAKVKELYSLDGDIKTNGDGAMRKAALTGNTWKIANGSEAYKNFSYWEFNTADGEYCWKWNYGDTNPSQIRYNPTTGLIREVWYDIWWQSANRATVTTGLDPTIGDVIPSLPNVQFRGGMGAAFTALSATFPTDPTDFLARVSDLAAFSTTKSYAVGDIAGYDGKVYKCTTAHTGAWDASHFTLATKAEVQAYLAGIVASISQKANAADLRYSFNAATVGTGTTPTVTNVLDRAINYATLGSSVTAATVTLPAAVANRSRDFYIDLTIEATDAPTLTFIDPATGTTANVAFGADSLADIAPGYNLVLWTELPNNRWLVSVKHEEAA